ncbi:MAG TPA: ribosome biogenesis GTPase Der [Candidatus Limnocylindrales bacterium]|jgi:GTP-binding protein
MSGSGLPVVAIVGRPNVGKSTLFNRIVGERAAIVEDRARTTRDRLYGDAEWNGRPFLVVDTGGLELDPDDPIEAKVQEQARVAIAEADVIVFLVDAISGPTAADLEAAELLRRAKAPVLLAVNKSDNAKRELDANEFWSFGFEQTMPIAANHGRGVADLLDEVVLALPPAPPPRAGARSPRELLFDEIEPGESGGEVELADDEAIDEEALVPKVALVGRPNVGKSSLLNALLGHERTIVSEVPGTTRDAIDTTLAWGQGELVLIDTAGIRRRGKVATGSAADRFSTIRSLKAIARADVAVLLIDGVDGLTAQDAHIAGYVVEEGRGLVVAVNKWDAVEEKTGKTFDQYVTWIRNDAPFLDFAPVVSISARTGQRIERALELAVDVWGEWRRRIPTAELNKVVAEAVLRNEPPVTRGRRSKIFYATQASSRPPTFVFFARDAAAVHFSYQRYLENQLREAFGFLGTPIRLVFRERASADDGRRRRGGAKRSGGAGRPATRPTTRPRSKARA